MGEYIGINGEQMKLGTCEDLYYVTYDQARQLLTRAVQVPGNLPPREYLDPKHQWRYRFPFPEEDGRAAGLFDDFNKGRVFSCLPGAPFALSPDNHDTICVSIALGGVGGIGGHNVNTRVACPASGRLDRHSPIDSWPVEIVQQRLMQMRPLDRAALRLVREQVPHRPNRRRGPGRVPAQLRTRRTQPEPELLARGRGSHPRRLPGRGAGREVKASMHYPRPRHRAGALIRPGGTRQWLKQ